LTTHKKKRPKTRNRKLHYDFFLPQFGLPSQIVGGLLKPHRVSSAGKSFLASEVVKTNPRDLTGTHDAKNLTTRRLKHHRERKMPDRPEECAIDGISSEESVGFSRGCGLRPLAVVQCWLLRGIVLSQASPRRPSVSSSFRGKEWLVAGNFCGHKRVAGSRVSSR